MKKLLVSFGTRPEAIKMCELVGKLKEKKCFEVKVLVTGQHSGMLKKVLSDSEITPDYDLNIMKIGQTLSYITAEVVKRADEVISELLPDIVLVHGDTTSAFAVALAAYYRGINVAHIEAGLRTYNRASPFPEEFNRAAIALVAKYHFAPTESSRQNLIAEKIPPEDIFVTGNTVIDALIKDIDISYTSKYNDFAQGKRLIILTAHRRENIDKLSGIFSAVKRLVKTYENICIIYPVHSNEKIYSLAKKVFSECERVYLSKPLSAYDFHNLLYRASVVMTDSGGVHEEATYLRKPTLILRNITERKELFTNKHTKLVGTNENTIFSEAKSMLENIDTMSDCNAPVNTLLGDGNASGIIADILENKLGQ